MAGPQEVSQVMLTFLLVQKVIQAGSPPAAPLLHTALLILPEVQTLLLPAIRGAGLNVLGSDVLIIPAFQSPPDVRPLRGLTSSSLFIRAVYTVKLIVIVVEIVMIVFGHQHGGSCYPAIFFL